MRLMTILAGSVLAAGAAAAAEPARFDMTIRNHRFEPAEVRAPANTPIVISVKNEDPTAEEFDSGDLGVEKVIPGGRSLAVRIRPLEPGRYNFMGETTATRRAAW